MKKLPILTVTAVFALSAIALAAEETPNPHQAANTCLNTPCETRQCIAKCEQLCDSCHNFPKSAPDLSNPTAWNPTGVTINQVYPQLTEEGIIDLANVCKDCHGEKFAASHNHPVDIQYLPKLRENHLIESPKGPLLVCDSNQRCQVRCITCHNMHPPENEQQVNGLLRMNNAGSALCTSCHAIAGDSSSETH